MGDNFMSRHHVVHNPLTAHEDIFNGSPATDVVNMEQWARVTFLVVKSAGATGTAKLTVESCDNVTPDTTTEINFFYREQTTIDAWLADWVEQTTPATGFTTTAGANTVVEITVTSDMLSGTDKYVRLQATEVVNSEVDGAILTVLSEPRYGAAIPSTVLT